MILKERFLPLNLKPFKILGIEHVGIAVETLDSLSYIFSDIFGLKFLGSEKIIDQQVITDIYDTGGGKLEFLKAIVVFLNKHAIVIGPTPPGTGVIAEAFSKASLYFTSPTKIVFFSPFFFSFSQHCSNLLALLMMFLQVLK